MTPSRNSDNVQRRDELTFAKDGPTSNMAKAATITIVNTTGEKIGDSESVSKVYLFLSLLF